MTSLLARVGRRCAARPLLVIGIWLVVAGAITGLSLTAGGKYTQHERLPGTEVERGIDELDRSFPAAAAETADLVVHTSSREADRIGSGHDRASIGAAARRGGVVRPV
jgi:RND superfamily putative drug exporter